MYSSLLDLQEHKNLQFPSFARILFVNKFILLTQITEVLKITQIFSSSSF